MGKRCVQTQRKPGSKQRKLRLTFGCVVSACAIFQYTRGNRVRRGFRSLRARAEQEGFFYAADLETVRVSRNPTKVTTANGEVRTKSDSVCQRFGFLRDGTGTRRPCRLDNSSRIMDIPVGGPVVRKHIFQKMAVRHHAVRRTTCAQFFQVLRADLEGSSEAPPTTAIWEKLTHVLG